MIRAVLRHNKKRNSLKVFWFWALYWKGPQVQLIRQENLASVKNEISYRIHNSSFYSAGSFFYEGIWPKSRLLTWWAITEQPSQELLFLDVTKQELKIVKACLTTVKLQWHANGDYIFQPANTTKMLGNIRCVLLNKLFLYTVTKEWMQGKSD